MKILNNQPPFIKFLIFAVFAIATNLLSSYWGGFAKSYTSLIYLIGTVLLTCFIVMYKMGYQSAAKLASTLFINIFLFCFSYIYGLHAMAFIYYFPFLISYLYMYKDSESKKEAKVFTVSCFFFIIVTFIVCSMEGLNILTPKQISIMYLRNFMVAFVLSAYYFNAIFNSLTVQMKIAQEASASKARFLSMMSHELRTPLNGIICSINLMDSTALEQEKRMYSGVLKTSSQNLLKLVNNVLDYSKASSGKMELSPVNCSIPTLLTDMEAVFRGRMEEKGLKLRLRVDDQAKRYVLLDDIRFEQVMSNLLSNALKFTETGTVEVAAKCLQVKKSTVEIEFSVSDTGKGLTKEQRKKIFESFNNICNKSRRLESAGLGLSICKMIVELMGGELLIESEPDKGSRFYFTLSLPLAETEEDKPEVGSAGDLSLAGARILIAEDNPINMMVTREFLKRWNVQISEAVDGLKAKQALVENADIDLLLLDLQMPGMNGYELMEWIQEEGFTFPVLAFTAQILSNEEKKDLEQQGFLDFISKPFAPEELLQKIQFALLKQGQTMLAETANL